MELSKIRPNATLTTASYPFKNCLTVEILTKDEFAKERSGL